MQFRETKLLHSKNRKLDVQFYYVYGPRIQNQESCKGEFKCTPSPKLNVLGTPQIRLHKIYLISTKNFKKFSRNYYNFYFKKFSKNVFNTSDFSQNFQKFSFTNFVSLKKNIFSMMSLLNFVQMILKLSQNFQTVYKIFWHCCLISQKHPQFANFLKNYPILEYFWWSLQKPLRWHITFFF